MSSVTFDNLNRNNSSDIVFHDSEFVKHPFKEVGKHRIYYKQINKTWISFVVLEFVSSNCSPEDPWTNPNSELIVEANFFGEIAFDGIRHAYMPYWFYLNELELIDILKTINKLAHDLIEGYEEA